MVYTAYNATEDLMRIQLTIYILYIMRVRFDALICVQ